VLPIVLSVIAGSADIVSFLMLNLFSAHITGNLAILAAHVVGGGDPHIGQLLSIPVFLLGAASTRYIALSMPGDRFRALRVLLALQLVLLAAFLVIGAASGPVDVDAPAWILVGMLGVCAMAIQNGLVQVTLPGTPSTAVMTTNVTRFSLDTVEAIRGRDGGAFGRAVRTGAIILGFLVGCGLGAVAVAALGIWAMTLPVGLAAVALVISLRLIPPQG
jgi:uncharacterized membrane protein YoaK (UPF0700 family)